MKNEIKIYLLIVHIIKSTINDSKFDESFSSRFQL